MRFVNAPTPRPAQDGAAEERARFRWLLIAMAFISLTLAAVFGRHGVLDVRRYRAERDRLRTEIASAEVEQRHLEADVAAIRKNPAALERVAREELGLGRQGEVLILLRPQPPDAPPAAPH